ncbi:MAG: protealysin inhibitor emfourin [Actinomycetota bacterium]
MPEEQVRVEFQRSGGFAGMTMKATVDTAELSEEEARVLREMVEKVDWDRAGQNKTMPTRGADRFQYDFVVTRGERCYELTLPEAAVPDELKPLVERMTELARPH